MPQLLSSSSLATDARLSDCDLALAEPWKKTLSPCASRSSRLLHNEFLDRFSALARLQIRAITASLLPVTAGGFVYLASADLIPSCNTTAVSMP